MHGLQARELPLEEEQEDAERQARTEEALPVVRQAHPAQGNEVASRVRGNSSSVEQRYVRRAMWSGKLSIPHISMNSTWAARRMMGE